VGGWVEARFVPASESCFGAACAADSIRPGSGKMSVVEVAALESSVEQQL
jgi:hypothetical protein